MPHFRCPKGCFVELEGPLPEIVTCPGCHITYGTKQFQLAEAGSSTSIVNRVSDLTSEEEAQIIERLTKIARKKPGALQSKKKFWQSSSETCSMDVTREAKSLYGQIVRQLMQAELTWNFSVGILPALLKSKRILNTWQLGREMDKDAKERDTVETQAFSPLSQDVLKKTTESNLPLGSARPVYFVLNVGKFPAGGAPDYGKSYFILRDSVKNRCTYTATDSVQMNRQDGRPLRPQDVCAFHAIERVLLRTSDKYLEFLVDHVRETALQRDMEFIEAQGWAEIDLTKDVEAIVISEWELDELVLRTKEANEKNPDPSLADWVELDENGREEKRKNMIVELDSFCSDNGIKWNKIHLDAFTMNSINQRPTNWKYGDRKPQASGRKVSIWNDKRDKKVAIGDIVEDEGKFYRIKICEVFAREGQLFDNPTWVMGVRFFKEDRRIEVHGKRT